MGKETIYNCVINRADAILNILKDIRKCESKIMIENGYKEIEGLTNGMIKMINRELNK